MLLNLLLINFSVGTNMTQTILLPGWGNLSHEEKQMVEEWIKSILLGHKASANLLKLLKHNQDSTEFMAKLEEILSQSDDFEIIESDTTLKAAKFIETAKFSKNIGIILVSCESVCKGDPVCLEQCMKSS